MTSMYYGSIVRRVVVVCAAVSVAALVLIGAAMAADEHPRLTVDQTLSLAAGLLMFDGYTVACKVKGVEDECKRQYAMEKGVRLTLALNLDQAQRIARLYVKTRQDMIAQYMLTGIDGPKDYAAKFHVTEDEANEQIKKFNADDRAALDKPVDVNFARITKSDIKIDDNPYPPSMLTMILPILD